MTIAVAFSHISRVPRLHTSVVCWMCWNKLYHLQVSGYLSDFYYTEKMASRLTTLYATSYVLMFCIMPALLANSDFSDVFLSSQEMALLLESEANLLGFIHGWLRRKHEDTSDAEYARMLERLAKEKPRPVPAASDAQHPLDAYAGLRRFTSYWHNYIARLDPIVGRSVRESLSGSNIIYPDEETLHSVRLAIVRLQAAYNLSAVDLMTSSQSSLTPDDVISFANDAEFCGLHDVAASWRSVPLTSAPRNNPEHCRQQKGQRLESGQESETTLKRNKKFYALCKRFINAKGLVKLKSKGCQYSYGIVPIQRWETEILSFDPYIALFYDFVTEKESKVIIAKATLRLEKALTGPDPRDFVLNTERRLSKASWFEDASPSVFRRISHRIEQLTGLKTGYRAERSFGEAYQVVNYGIGGFYTPHYDFFKIDEAFKTAGKYLQDSGDRAATFMVYLGNVTRGGATVFPRLGIGTPPIKNGALFWNNFAPENGLRDERTLHGGCPVISGHKWVTNKWIHEISTAMTRSCRKESSVKQNPFKYYT